MGKDLNGNDLGKGFGQRKSDKTYIYRTTIDKKRIVLYDKTIDGIKHKAEKLKTIINMNKEPSHIKIPSEIIKFLKPIRRIKTDNDRIKNNEIKFGYLYFITDGQYIKIGVSNDVDKRLKTLKTGSSQDIRLLGKYYLPNPYSVEALLHQLLKNYRINGEWFDISFLFVDNGKR